MHVWPCFHHFGLFVNNVPEHNVLLQRSSGQRNPSTCEEIKIVTTKTLRHVIKLIKLETMWCLGANYAMRRRDTELQSVQSCRPGFLCPKA